MSTAKTFGSLPEDALYLVGSYLTPGSSLIRQVATRTDPYDPQIITDLLEIGVDPSEILARERLRLRRIQELKTGLAGKIVDALYRVNPTESWTVKVGVAEGRQYLWVNHLEGEDPKNEDPEEELSRWTGLDVFQGKVVKSYMNDSHTFDTEADGSSILLPAKKYFLEPPYELLEEIRSYDALIYPGRPITCSSKRHSSLREETPTH